MEILGVEPSSLLETLKSESHASYPDCFNLYTVQVETGIDLSCQTTSLRSGSDTICFEIFDALDRRYEATREKNGLRCRKLGSVFAIWFLIVFYRASDQLWHADFNALIARYRYIPFIILYYVL